LIQTLNNSLYIMFLCFALALSYPLQTVLAQDSGEFEVARIKYRGGGDWYNNPSALENLLRFARENLPISVATEYKDVALGNSNLHNYPFAFLTGHGTISVNSGEASNLRDYLQNGGFLYIDDDYGLDKYARRLMKEVFPDEDFIELPFDHPIYHMVYGFNNGPPKIHKHDGKQPQGYGIFYEGRLVVYYTYESNVSDGWANPEVHKDPESVRQKAFRMGANILTYALTY